MNGAGRRGVGGGGDKPRLGRMPAAIEIGLYGSALMANPRPKREFKARSAGRSSRISVALLSVAAILILSSVAVLATGPADNQPLPAADDRQPLPPWNVEGYVYYSDGTTPVVNCLVNVTNTRTGDWNLTYTDDTYGWYEFNMRFFDGGVQEGDLINVTATKDLDIGWAEGLVPNGFLSPLNVIMSGLIPEFPMVVLPVVGLMALFVVVGLVRRKKQ